MFLILFCTFGHRCVSFYLECPFEWSTSFLCCTLDDLVYVFYSNMYMQSKMRQLSIKQYNMDFTVVEDCFVPMEVAYQCPYLV